MSASTQLLAFLSRGIDDLATGLARLGATLGRRRQIELIEQADGSFLAFGSRGGAPERLDPPLRFDQNRLAEPETARLGKVVAGVQVHVVLAPARFVFRPLELPRAAGAFLDGVVRTQIDRLSPWSASAAVFGWSAPVDIGSDRIALTVAVTARAQVDQIAQALIANKAASVEMSTRVGEEGRPVILGRQAGGETGVRRLRLALVAGLAGSSLAFVASFAAWITIGAGYDAHFEEVQNQVAERRAEVMGQQGSRAEQALRGLESKKRSDPSAVLVLEALSKTLPDDAHLTDLRIEGGKVQIVGFANDAPALIPLIEQSGSFARATFFAPTLRGPNGGDNFHIEAQIEPPFPPAANKTKPAQ